MSTMANSSAMAAFLPSIQSGMVTRSPTAAALTASPSQAARTLFVTRLASFQADVAARRCRVFRRQWRSLAGPTLPSIHAVLANDARVAREDSTEDVWYTLGLCDFLMLYIAGHGESSERIFSLVNIMCGCRMVSGKACRCYCWLVARAHAWE